MFQRYVYFFLVIIANICTSNTCDYTFSKEDETYVFEVTEKFETFTFKEYKNVSIECESGTIDYEIKYDNPYIWEIRFQLYNNTQPDITRCQCSDEITTEDDYKECMKSVRDKLGTAVQNADSQLYELIANRTNDICASVTTLSPTNIS